LAEHYNVPHIHAKKVLDEIENWDKEKEIVWKKKQEVKQRMEEESLKR
jgi:hypothetical protein